MKKYELNFIRNYIITMINGVKKIDHSLVNMSFFCPKESTMLFSGERRERDRERKREERILYFPCIRSPHKGHNRIERKVEASTHHNDANDSGLEIVQFAKHFENILITFS